MPAADLTKETFDSQYEIITKIDLDDEYRILKVKEKDTGHVFGTVARETEVGYDNCSRLIDAIDRFPQVSGSTMFDIIQSLWPMIDKTKIGGIKDD